MSLIPTWKNVDGIDAKAAILGLAQAGELANKGADAFGKVISDQNVVRKANYDVDTETLNRTLQAEVAKTDNLTELKDSLKNKFNASAVQQQFGNRVDLSALEQTGVKQLDKLRTNAVNTAASIGTQVAKENKDITIGSEIFANNLRKLGVSEPQVMKQQALFEQNAAPLQNQFTKEKTEFTDALYNNAPLEKLTTNKLIDTFVAEQKKGPDGKMVDQELLTKRLTNHLTGIIKDTDAEHKEALYSRSILESDKRLARLNKTEAEEKALNVFNNTVLKNIGNGVDPDQAIKLATEVSGITGTQQIPASNAIRTFVENKQVLKKDQERVYAEAKDAVTAQVTQLETDLNNHIGGLQKNLGDLTGLTPNVMDFAEKAVIQNGGIVGKIMSSLTDTGMEPSDWFFSLKTSPSTVSAILNSKYQQIRSIPGINDVEASGLLWLAYQDSVGNSYGFGGAKGVNPKPLDKTVEKRIIDYDKGEILRNQIIKDSNQAKKEITTATLAANGSLLKWLSETEKANVSNNSGTPKSYEEQRNALMSAIPKASSEILNAKARKEITSKLISTLTHTSEISKADKLRLTKELNKMSGKELKGILNKEVKLQDTNIGKILGVDKAIILNNAFNNSLQQTWNASSNLGNLIIDKGIKPGVDWALSPAH